MTRSPNLWAGLFTAIALTAVALVVVPTQPLPHPTAPPPEQARESPITPAVVVQGWSTDNVRQTARDRLRPHLLAAEQRANAAVDTHLQILEEFFKEVRRRIPRFATEALGFHSKWRCVADYLPLVRGDHSSFLQARFREHLFSPEQLQNVIEQVVRSFLAELDSVDSRLLVDVQADLSDLPPVLPLQQFDADRLEESFRRILQRVQDDVVTDASRNVGQTVVSLVAGEVLTSVALRMGISASVLGGGAASSLGTLGIGFAVGLIVDQLVSAIWDWWADPRGQLVAELEHRFQDLQRLLVDGDHDQLGLRARLQRLANDRMTHRRRALLELIGASGEGP